MSVIDLVLWASGGGGSAAAAYGAVKYQNYKLAKARLPKKINGRTAEEWFELILAMGKEEFERLARPAMDGLKDSEFGWDAKKLMTEKQYGKLMREFYPDKYCKHCEDLECRGYCDGGWFAKESERKSRRVYYSGTIKPHLGYVDDDLDVWLYSKSVKEYEQHSKAIERKSELNW